MRTLLLMVSIPALALAGMASAAPLTNNRQCHIDWFGQTAPQCKVQPVSFQSQRNETPEHHVLTRAEIRAELDAIRINNAPPASEVASVRSSPVDRSAND